MSRMSDSEWPEGFWKEEWAKDRRLRKERLGIADKETNRALYDGQPTDWSRLPRVAWPSGKHVLDGFIPNDTLGNAALGYLSARLAALPITDPASLSHVSKAIGALCLQLLSPFKTANKMDYDTYARLVADCLESSAVNVLDEDIAVPLPCGSTQRVSGALVGASILRQGKCWLTLLTSV